MEEILDDFLRFFFPNADRLFDLEKGFEYLDKELEQLFPPENEKCSPKYVDKLVKVYSRSGVEAWLLVHIEVQGYRDDAFSDRMFTYYYRIWDKYRKPITAFAILTDDCKYYLPGQFEQACLGTSLCFRFNSFKVLDQSDEELADNDNPFAQAVLVTKTALLGKRLTPDKLYRLKIDLAKRLLSRDIPKRKIGKLLEFLKFYVRLESDELDDEFDLEVNRAVNQSSITMTFAETILMIVREEAEEKGIGKGLEKGISQERLERNTTFVQNLLRETNFGEEEIARLVGVPVEFVREIKQKL